MFLRNAGQKNAKNQRTIFAGYSRNYVVLDSGAFSKLGSIQILNSYMPKAFSAIIYRFIIYISIDIFLLT